MSAFEKLGEIGRRVKESQQAIVDADVMQDLESIAEALKAIATIQDLAADALSDFARSIVPPPMYDSRIDG